MSIFRRIWGWIVARFRPGEHGIPKPPKVAPRATLLAADIVPPPEPRPEPPPSPEPAPKLNRKTRRTLSALEKARRKHDIFVDPKGTPPVPKPREKHEKKDDEDEPQPPAVPAPEVKDAEVFYYETHHRDQEGPEVLYRESETWGEYNFRDTILEQLERYFVYLKRMKKNSPEAYGFYKEVGAHIVPYAGSGADFAARCKERDRSKHVPRIDLPPFFNKHRPSFGCFVFGADPETEKYEIRQTKHELKKGERGIGNIMVPKFMYFTKYENPPPELQPMSGGDIYNMTIIWDRPFDPKLAKRQGSPQEYGIFISTDGRRIQALRCVETKQIEVLVKKKRRDAHGRIDFYHQIPQRLWRIPHDYEEWAELHGTNAQEFLASIFCNCARHFEYANYGMVRIAVKKDDMTAVFSVNHRRMAYFFQDRDYVLNEHGQRKPVFHMVRAHERHTLNGVAHVRFHFRGEREFTWAGYDVSITVPGKDHFMLPELNIGAIDDYWTEPGEEYLSGEKWGKYLVNAMKRGHKGTIE